MHAAVLRYLEHVARLGSIRRAAEVLNVASSAVNRQILNLEEEIGCPLFERRREGVRLTPAGEFLVRHVRRTLADYQRTRSDIAALAGRVQGTVRIISIRPLIDRFLGRAAVDLSRLQPDLFFNITGFDPAETGEKSDLTAHDLAIIFTEGRKIDHAVLTSLATEVGAIVSPTHPLAAKGVASFAECARQHLLVLDDLWSQRIISNTDHVKGGGRVNYRIVANAFPVIVNAIRAGAGIGLFTPVGFLDELKAGDLVFVPLSEPAFHETQISLVTPHHQQLSAPARVVAEFLVDRFEEMQRTMPPLSKGAAQSAANSSRAQARAASKF